jgi:Rap1a immunity proteins
MTSMTLDWIGFLAPLSCIVCPLSTSLTNTCLSYIYVMVFERGDTTLRNSVALLSLVTLGVGLISTSVDAEYMDGNMLFERCTAKKPDCIAYIIGVVDAQQSQDETVASINAPPNKRFVCRPSNVTGGQLMDVVTKHLTERPAERHWPAAVLVRNAMVAAFPCR